MPQIVTCNEYGCNCPPATRLKDIAGNVLYVCPVHLPGRMATGIYKITGVRKAPTPLVPPKDMDTLRAQVMADLGITDAFTPDGTRRKIDPKTGKPV